LATISKRAKGWFVQIRRKGYQAEYKTLPTKDAAERWAREREARIDRGDDPVDQRALRSVAIGDLIDRYVREVTPGKRSAESERLRLNKMRQNKFAALTIADLSVAAIMAYRDSRGATVKPGTVARELGLLHVPRQHPWHRF
jgi:hypothetical protein